VRYRVGIKVNGQLAAAEGMTNLREGRDMMCYLRHLVFGGG